MYYVIPCVEEALARAKVYTAREIGFLYDMVLSEIKDDEHDGYLKRYLEDCATYVNFILAQHTKNWEMHLGIFYPHQNERGCAFAFQYYLNKQMVWTSRGIPEKRIPRDIFQNGHPDPTMLSPIWGSVKLAGGGRINAPANLDRSDSPVLDAFFGVPALPEEYMTIVRERVLEKLNVRV